MNSLGKQWFNASGCMERALLVRILVERIKLTQVRS